MKPLYCRNNYLTHKVLHDFNEVVRHIKRQVQREFFSAKKRSYFKTLYIKFHFYYYNILYIVHLHFIHRHYTHDKAIVFYCKSIVVQETKLSTVSCKRDIASRVYVYWFDYIPNNFGELAVLSVVLNFSYSGLNQF